MHTTASPELHKWMPDAAARCCRQCHAPFSMLVRRHHCRVCYHIFCSQCCSTFVQVPHLFRRETSHTLYSHVTKSQQPSKPAQHQATQVQVQVLASGLQEQPSQPVKSAWNVVASLWSSVQTSLTFSQSKEVKAVYDSTAPKTQKKQTKTTSVPQRREKSQTQVNVIVPDFAWWLRPQQTKPNNNLKTSKTSKQNMKTSSTSSTAHTSAIQRRRPASTPIAIQSDGPTQTYRRRQHNQYHEYHQEDQHEEDLQDLQESWCREGRESLEVHDDVMQGELQLPRAQIKPSNTSTSTFMYLLKDLTLEGFAGCAQEERVCDRCARDVSRVASAEPTMRVLLSNPYIDLRDWAVLSCVSKSTNMAVSFLKDKWTRMAQHMCYTTTQPSVVTRTLLDQNKHLLRGHPSWNLLVARTDLSSSFEWEFPSSLAVPCSVVGCHASCIEPSCSASLCIGQYMIALRQLPVDHALNVLSLAKLSDIAKTGPPGTLLCFLPSLLAMSRLVLHQVIVPAAARDAETLYMAYFCARAQPSMHDVCKALLQNCATPKQLQEIRRSEYLLVSLQNACIQAASSSLTQTSCLRAHACAALKTAGLRWASNKAKPLLPGSAKYRVQSLNEDTVRQLSSATKPWVVGCTILDTSTNTTTNRMLMFKSESVWNDAVVMLCQQYLTTACRQADLELQLETYHIMPVSPQSGIVLFVDACHSLASIQRESTILAYLIDTQQGTNASDIQQTFMRSCASNCVLSLLFGFGDRHLNNILVSSSGRLVHIDFGFLWSREPSLSTHRFRLPDQQIRITKGMLDVFRTHYYDAFLVQCASVSRHVTKHATNLFNICWALVDLQQVQEAKIQAHFNPFVLAPALTSAHTSTSAAASAAAASSPPVTSEHLAGISRTGAVGAVGASRHPADAFEREGEVQTRKAAQVVHIIDKETRSSSSAVSALVDTLFTYLAY